MWIITVVCTLLGVVALYFHSLDNCFAALCPFCMYNLFFFFKYERKYYWADCYICHVTVSRKFPRWLHQCWWSMILNIQSLIFPMAWQSMSDALVPLNLCGSMYVLNKCYLSFVWQGIIQNCIWNWNSWLTHVVTYTVRLYWSRIIVI